MATRTLRAEQGRETTRDGQSAAWTVERRNAESERIQAKRPGPNGEWQAVTGKPAKIGENVPLATMRHFLHILFGADLKREVAENAQAIAAQPKVRAANCPRCASRLSFDHCRCGWNKAAA